MKKKIPFRISRWKATLISIIKIYVPPNNQTFKVYVTVASSFSPSSDFLKAGTWNGNMEIGAGGGERVQ